MEHKKYCKNCKYWHEWSYPFNLVYGPDCIKKAFKENKELSKIVGEPMGSFETCNYKELNKNNDCPHYEKKSFWEYIFS